MVGSLCMLLEAIPQFPSLFAPNLLGRQNCRPLGTPSTNPPKQQNYKYRVTNASMAELHIQ